MNSGVALTVILWVVLKSMELVERNEVIYWTVADNQIENYWFNLLVGSF